ncbi:LOW QUALITY PROTEIN: hypothetical protein HID58_069163, partial [Brassica napus]
GNLTATDFCFCLASQKSQHSLFSTQASYRSRWIKLIHRSTCDHSSISVWILVKQVPMLFYFGRRFLTVLNSFVSKRVDRMMEAGLLEEVRELHDPKADYSVGYRRANRCPRASRVLMMLRISSGPWRKMLDAAVKKIKENTEILACRQLLKIQRLSKKWKLSMHRVDATEVFLKRTEEEADEAWENLVARQTKRRE